MTAPFDRGGSRLRVLLDGLLAERECAVNLTDLGPDLGASLRGDFSALREALGANLRGDLSAAGDSGLVGSPFLK